MSLHKTTDVYAPSGPVFGFWGEKDPDEAKAEARRHCEQQIAQLQRLLAEQDQWTVTAGEDSDA